MTVEAALVLVAGLVVALVVVCRMVVVVTERTAQASAQAAREAVEAVSRAMWGPRDPEPEMDAERAQELVERGDVFAQNPLANESVSTEELERMFPWEAEVADEA